MQNKLVRSIRRKENNGRKINREEFSSDSWIWEGVRENSNWWNKEKKEEKKNKRRSTEEYEKRRLMKQVSSPLFSVFSKTSLIY